jgi:hypothetical protein
MEAQQDILWIFNFLYLWIVLFLVWQPLVGASEVEESKESSQKQKKP